ncbi:hypothetical protein A3J90_07550 [candidate division WOR-1 bacterium RIFOXYC2_FULL_37_10]|nr:MAG: hypothetical protein A3J90_07550 [candidate division WOR-1 bacterium RIFOXYC2_FULL_37_10]
MSTKEIVNLFEKILATASFINAFKALDITKDLNIFDIKKLHTENEDLYEDIQDVNFIKNFIKEGQKSKKDFVTAGSLFK